MSLLRSLLFFFGAAVAAALAVLCLWVDIRVFGNDIPEVSLTEVVQESVLAVIVLVHFLLARNYPHLRYSNILIGGFFLAKLFQGGDSAPLLAQMKRDFTLVRNVKPGASRADSSELYVLATGYRRKAVEQAGSEPDA